MGNDHTAWMPVYWRDVLAETVHLSPAQFGAYCLLIAAHWNSRGPLLSDPQKLRRIARMDIDEWRDTEPALAGFFTAIDGRWLHTGVMSELSKAEARYRLRAEAGRRGGQAKGKHRLSPALVPPEQPEAQAQSHGSPEGDPGEPTLGTSGHLATDDYEQPNFPNGRTKRHATRLTTDWSPNEAGYDFALSLGIDRTSADNIAAQFRDYWLAKPGSDALKTDWDATWRNWLRKHIDFHGAGPWPGDGGRRSQGDRQGRGSVVTAVRALLPPT